MILTLKRQTDIKQEFTEGLLYFNGVFFCDTLEDPIRDLNKDGDLDNAGEGKVYGDTAIPYGEYEVRITFSNRFQKYMLLVCNVKHFSGIRFHGGTTKEDSHGCILVGDKEKPGYLKNSVAMSGRLLQSIITRCCEKQNGEPVVYNDSTYGLSYKLKELITLKII